MSFEQITLAFVFLQIASLSVMLFFSVRLIRESNRSLTAVFLTFTLTLWLLTDLYWIIYDLMRPDSRMPFAVNEIGEAAMFLLFAATLSAAVPHWFPEARSQAFGALFFAACNIALWIAWSGEWLQDLLVGAVFACFLVMIACALKSTQALKNGDWISLAIICSVLILAQGLTFIVPQGTKAALETGCYILLADGIVFWAVRNVSAWKKAAEAHRLMALAFALTGWIITAKYMSDGGWYTAFLIAETLSLPLLYLSVRKAVVRA